MWLQGVGYSKFTPHMIKSFLCFALMIISVMQSCKSDSKDQSNREEIESTVQDAKEELEAAKEDIQATADDLKESLDEQATKLKNLLKTENGSVELISLSDLKKLCPTTIDRIPRESIKAEGAGAFGFKINTVNGVYEKGDKRIKLDLIDFGGFSPALLGLAAWSATDIYREDDNGFERVIDWHGYKAFEKSDIKNNESSLSIIYKKRLVINVSADFIALDDLKSIVEDDIMHLLDDLDIHHK